MVNPFIFGRMNYEVCLVCIEKYWKPIMDVGSSYLGILLLRRKWIYYSVPLFARTEIYLILKWKRGPILLTIKLYFIIKSLHFDQIYSNVDSGVEKHTFTFFDGSFNVWVMKHLWLINIETLLPGLYNLIIKRYFVFLRKLSTKVSSPMWVYS